MNRVRWLIAGLWLIAFWLFAGLVLAPALERTLNEQATALLTPLPTGYAPIQVRFDGQQAILHGPVRQESQRAKLLAAVREQVRSGGFLSAHLNPVQSVMDAMEQQPYAPGWLMIAAQGPRGQLLGHAASEAELHDLAALIQERWSSQGGRLESRLKPRPDLHDEAPDLRTTLGQLPLPDHRGGGDSAQIQLARLGGAWQRLVIEAEPRQLKEQALALGIAEPDWESSLLPLIEATRRYQKEERQRLAEAERQRKLPPPHVFLAARENRLLVRGEMATLGLKRELLNTLIAAFPDWRVMDDVRVNPQRRAVGEWGPITSALLPDESVTDLALKGKSLRLGLSGSAWETVDFLVDAEAQPWREKLPQDLPASLLQADHRMVIQWLQGKATGIPALPIRAQPSFLTLTLLPDKVILAGQLAEESLHSQLVEAARQKYAGQALVMTEDLLVRGTCEPSQEIQQTLRSLPPLPDLDSRGTLAFAKPGSVWRSTTAGPGMDQPGAVAKADLLPADFPAGMAEDSFWEGFAHLRQHWKSLVDRSAPRSNGPAKAPSPELKPQPTN